MKRLQHIPISEFHKQMHETVQQIHAVIGQYMSYCYVNFINEWGLVKNVTAEFNCYQTFILTTVGCK